MKDNCLLCDGISDDFINIKEQYKELNSNVTLFETRSFKIIPDKFPIAPNHIIILPKEHINTFAEFNESQSREIGYIIDRLENTTEAEKFILFEHGTNKNEELNTPPHIKSIFHAHLHFIPNVDCSTNNMSDFFNKKNVDLVNTDTSPLDIKLFENKYLGNSQLINFIKDNVIYNSFDMKSVESYFYIKNSDNTQLLFPERIVNPQIPSQFLREALSEKCDTPEWNWKIDMSIEARQKYGARIIQTSKLFKEHDEKQIYHVSQRNSSNTQLRN